MQERWAKPVDMAAIAPITNKTIPFLKLIKSKS
jgi:hypothetical protein